MKSKSDLLNKIISEKSLSQIQKFEVMQKELSAKLLSIQKDLSEKHQESLSKQKSTKDKLEGLQLKLQRIKSEESSLVANVKSTEQSLSEAISKINDIEHKIHEERINAEKTEKTIAIATTSATTATVILSVTTFGLASPVALGASTASLAALSGALAAIIVRIKDFEARKKTLEEQKNCHSQRLSNARSRLNELSKKKDELNSNLALRVEQEKQTKKSLDDIYNRLNNVTSALQNINNQCVLQGRIEKNSTNLNATVSHASQVGKYADLDSIKMAFGELRNRTVEFNSEQNEYQIMLEDCFSVLLENVDKPYRIMDEMNSAIESAKDYDDYA